MLKAAKEAWSKIDWQNVHWVNCGFMFITPLLALILVPVYFYHYGWSWGLFALFVLSYMINNMSITCGYHRYFAHRSYDAHPLIDLLYILIGAGAFQGTLLQWATDHRRHHREVDSDEDPYSINKGFWFAHMGWMLHKADPKYDDVFAPDLYKNKWIRFQHDHYVWVASVMGFGVPALIGWALGYGWGGLIILGLLRIVLTQHSTFFINSFCHTIGRQPYSQAHSARDSFIMAVLTFGEGYHNYHHEFQIDYRNGIKWYHWDPSKWWIATLSLVGLTRKLKKVAPIDVLRARLQLEESHLISAGVCKEKIASLKLQIVETQVRLKHMRDEYKRMKVQFQQSSKDKYIQLKKDIKQAQNDFTRAYSEWVYLRRAYA